MRRRGLALIVVIGVLGVLGVLAVAFVTMAQLERKASAQRVHAAKAYLLARSGLEDALARLALGQEAAYGGENWDGSADGRLSALEAAEEAYHVTGTATTADTWACPIRQAMRPSFFVRLAAGSPDPDLMHADGRKRGYSGRLSGDARPGGNHYALKVEARGGLHVNGGDLTATSEAGYNRTLRRILGNLAEEIDAAPSPVGDGIANNGIPVARLDGERLVTERPAGGWNSFGEIQARAWGGSVAKRAALEPYLALDAWVDAKVIGPTATPGMEWIHPTSWAELRTGKDDGHDPFPYFQRLRTASPPRLEPRAPVVLAWAKGRREVLAALLRDLRGFHLCEEGMGRNGNARATPQSGNILESMGEVCLARTWAPEARALAAFLSSYGGDLGSWQAFRTFTSEIPSTLLSESDPVREAAQRDLIAAVFNPNSDLNKFNPNASLWKRVDKMDLLDYAPEFSLHPVNGHDILSLGRVLAADGRLLASRALRGTAADLSVRVTTQREFVCRNLGRLEVAGDETGVPMPGDIAAGPFLTRSRGFSRTWGHEIATFFMLGTGIGLQSYPEPYQNTAAGFSINPADYDGNLQLATVDTPRDGLYGAAGAPGDMKMLARFSTGWDLEVFDSTAASGSRCRTDAFQVATTELTNSVLDPVRPSTLHPDGCYAEEGRIPCYPDRDNAHGFHGVMSFWVKPGYSPETRRGHRFVNWSNWSGISSAQDQRQFFYVGNAPRTGPLAPPQDRLSLMFEVGHQASDSTMEWRYEVARKPTPHRWHLISCFWDFRSPTMADAGEFVLDGGDPATERGSDSVYNAVLTDNTWTAASDITVDAPFSVPGYETFTDQTHHIFLGARAYFELDMAKVFGSGPDATFDEFAIYDFGGAEPDGAGSVTPATQATLESVHRLAEARFAEGRYYKGWIYPRLPAWYYGGNTDEQAAAWFSAPIRLPPGSLLKRVHWTFYRPAGLPDDFAEVETVAPSGTAYYGSESASRSTHDPLWTAERQSWAPNQPVAGPFRAHVVFRRVTPLGGADPSDTSRVLETPLLDSPIFDDLTLVYAPPGGSRLLSWGEGE